MDNNGGWSPRKDRIKRKRKIAWVWIGVLIVLLCAVWWAYDQDVLWRQDLDVNKTAKGEAASPDVSSGIPSDNAALIKPITEFLMLDLDTGWYRTADHTRMVTTDGGMHWHIDETESDMPVFAADNENPVNEALEAAFMTFSPAETIQVQGQSIAVKQAQPVSGPIGWVLAAPESGLEKLLLVTVDGGRTWHDEVTEEVRAAMLEEKVQRQLRYEESLRYASPDQAIQVMKPGPAWTLLPDIAYPGDVVLVRRGEPGELQWQDRTVELKPYKAGYYAYLPIPRALSPGEYAIGDQTLTIVEKTFDTQYLTVSEEMQSMRRNTERIQEDQKKIDAARAESAPSFLFDSEFVQPLEGRLSTPFGYTRYINGVLSSTHMAIDIAAPEGRPIQATNDGVVVLAEELYLTGNAIYIDHGMGLFSQYAHLSELHVEPGDVVKKGEIIGLVGSTGFSTGPHLHFTFWANNMPVNPDLFFDQTPFQWLPADMKKEAAP